MDAGINNVIYMELHSGPKMANSTCGKTIVAGTIDRGSTVYEIWSTHSVNHTIMVSKSRMMRWQGMWYVWGRR